LLDEILAREVDRLAESAVDPAGSPIDRGELTMRAIGAFTASGLIEEAEAIAALRRAGVEQSVDALRTRLDTAIEQARTAKDYSSATATPRRDLHPALARRLGIDMSRSMNSDEIANLLNGQRADGADIAGKQKQHAT